MKNQGLFYKMRLNQYFTFLELPSELLMDIIINYLTFTEFLSLRMTCKFLNKFCSDSYLLEKKIDLHFDFSVYPDEFVILDIWRNNFKGIFSWDIIECPIPNWIQVTIKGIYNKTKNNARKNILIPDWLFKKNKFISD